MSLLEAENRRAVSLLAWSALVVIETLCQVAIKYGGAQSGPFQFTPEYFIRAALAPWIWVAIGCYLAGFICWMLILRRSSLSRAFPTAGLVFISVLIASCLLFGDSIGWIKAGGIALITAGILLLGPDPEPAPGPAPRSVSAARAEPEKSEGIRANL